MKKTYKGYKVGTAPAPPELNEGVFITLDEPRKPNMPKMSLPVEQIFLRFLGKMLNVTIEEIEE